MKLSEAWLREWVSPSLSREELCDRLTMTGLEVDGIYPAAPQFTGVVVGKIQQVTKHPEADQLNICVVDVGQVAPLTIVCAATNVKVGMKAPLARLGAVLPNQVVIKATELRSVLSQGMLCSLQDIGLAEESEGLLELCKDAPVGQEIWEYLKLADHVIDVAITPNRGDCLSVKGMAREVAAITEMRVKHKSIPAVKATITDVFPVEIIAKSGCPRYVGRVIRGVKTGLISPMWLTERLRRGGIRTISPIVDVANYVMLELGQPMHAFDLLQLNQKIVVRMAHKDEEINLLDGTTAKLDEETLVIADAAKPLAIAGVMGGMNSGISASTQDIFLESAFFTPAVVARQRQAHNLNSDSAYRFERGVDPQIQTEAIERATRLILDIIGGTPGPTTEFSSFEKVELGGISPLTLTLRKAYLQSILGPSSITDQQVKDILTRLGFLCKKEKAQWQVQVPSYRFDVTQEVDLIEEIARLYGYDNIAPTKPQFPLQTHHLSEARVALPRVRRLLCDMGYHEVVTYSFVNHELQSLFDPERPAKALVNPITADMTVMRTNLWPGLISSYLYNRDRQQVRTRFFETGLCFIENQGKLSQVAQLGGLISGSASPEQWSVPLKNNDFYDIKGEIEDILQLTHIPRDDFVFKPMTHPALHPGQSAYLYRQEELIGFFGAIHPGISQKLGISEPILLFELNLDALLVARPPYFAGISKFPEIRRDLALLVDRDVPSREIQDTIVKSAGEWLRQVNLFDVYLGDGVPENKKSVAFALVLQHATRTLRDEEVVEIVDRVVRTLKQTLGIELRG